MIYGVYSVRDALNGFGQPMLDTNDQTAVRNFKVGISQNVGMQAALKDYDLYKIGSFNTEDGALIRLSPVELIESAVTAFGGDL